VRDIQRRLGFPTRFSEPNVAALAEADVPFRRAAPARPQTAVAKPERAKGDWPVTTGGPAPRRKPDGRPVRNGGRRRFGTHRSRQT
jgi:hypothetical protein